MFRVVYEGLGGSESMPLGTRCITEYKSEQDFESRTTDNLKVIGKDVSQEEARRLCNEVSGETLARAVFERTDMEGNWEMHLSNFAFEAREIGKAFEFHTEVSAILIARMSEKISNL